jgi:hypothetical protein
VSKGVPSNFPADLGLRRRLKVFDDEVNLKYYRLQKTSEGSISLAPGHRGAVKAPTAVGTGGDHHEQIELSRLIDIVNQGFRNRVQACGSAFLRPDSGRSRGRLAHPAGRDGQLAGELQVPFR